MLEWVDTFKYLGITINQNMTWSDHIESLVSRANRRIGLLRRVKHLLPHHARITLYNTLILPILDYADIVWGDKDNITLMNMLQIVQNKAAKTILDLPMYASSTEALSQIKSNQMIIYSKYLLQKYLGLCKEILRFALYMDPLPNYYNIIIKHNRYTTRH